MEYRCLDSILSDSLRLFDSLNQSDIARASAKVNSKISDFNNLLRSYREHEAREVLCQDMRTQLKNALKLEDELDR